ncbi:hypothetical protein AB0G02_09460 [Actinosynnema sp. NPDC023658]|uniref:hypothetical protein n=1 Tax=Actinosynnema sp. NPDC023658 TaxID=3155465 RepID=UPI0033FF2248
MLDSTSAARLANEVATVTASASKLAGAEPGRELPEVLTLLANVVGEDEHGLVARSELAGRIGWEVEAFGEALRAAGVPSAGKRRMPGHDNPVSVDDLDMIRAVIHGS